MIKKFLSKAFILSGITLILISFCLFVQNLQTEENLKISTSNILVEIFEQLEEIKIEKNDENLVEDYSDTEYTKEVLVDNSLYCFVLNIPSLGLQLPVQSNWSYENLNVSPCVYKSEPLSIAAHNYDTHFGKLTSLNIGDSVSIEYFSGEIDEYKVVSITKIYETDVEELENSDYDLSLFTCNYSNNSERILVRLNKIF
ncbi:MAG: sortase [Clostridia bacterium]